MAIIRSRVLFFAILLVASLLTGCVSIVPPVKVGLLAPFEGLYREVGYQALSAMRLAIDERENPDLPILPLALDSSLDPRRSEEKLLQDPHVSAIIGPLLAGVDSQAAGQRSTLLVDAVHPSALQADALLEYVSQTSRAAGLSGVTVGGPEPLVSELLANLDRNDVERLGENLSFKPDHALLWLGDPASGAPVLAAMRRSGSQAPFWPASAIGIRLLYLQAGQDLGPESVQVGPIYYLAKLDAGYEEWRTSGRDPSPLAYSVYRLTLDVIDRAEGTVAPPVEERLYLMELEEDGVHKVVAWEAVKRGE